MHKAGEKIRAYRKARGLSADDLGAMVGEKCAVPAQTVYSWEQRGRMARPKMMRRLQDLGICDAHDWLLPACAAA